SFSSAAGAACWSAAGLSSARTPSGRTRQSTRAPRNRTLIPYLRRRSRYGLQLGRQRRNATNSAARYPFAAALGTASGSALGRRERQRQGRSIRCQDRKAIAAVTGAAIRNTTHHGAAAPLYQTTHCS